eukprot:5818947-Alexandrium_andersonii.AAC.1
MGTGRGRRGPVAEGTHSRKTRQSRLPFHGGTVAVSAARSGGGTGKYANMPWHQEQVDGLGHKGLHRKSGKGKARCARRGL